MVIFFLDRYSRPYIGIYWEVSDFSSKTAGSLLSQSPCSGTFIATPSFNDSLRDPEHCHGLNVPNFKANIELKKTDKIHKFSNMSFPINFPMSVLLKTTMLKPLLSFTSCVGIKCHTLSYCVILPHGNTWEIQKYIEVHINNHDQMIYSYPLVN